MKIRKSNSDYKFLYEKVNNFNEWLNGKKCLKEVSIKDLLNNKWVFTSEEEKTLINKIKRVKSKRLDEVAEIFVGLQTSENSIYVIKDKDILKETNEYVRFETSKGEFEVEKELIKPYLEKKGP